MATLSFTPEFDNLLQKSGNRKQTLLNSSMEDIYNARTDLSPSAKKNHIKVLGNLNLLGIPLKDFAIESDNQLAVLNRIVGGVEKLGRSPMNSFIGDTQKLFKSVGVTGTRNETPLRTMMRAHLGEDVFTNIGLDVSKTDRLVPISYPSNIYDQSKLIASQLISDPSTKEAGTQMVLHMLGGYRASDFKNLRIENINFKTGIVKSIKLKTDKDETVSRAAYLPSAQRDVILNLVGGKFGEDGKLKSVTGNKILEGLVFPNLNKNDKIINKEFANITDKNLIPQIEYFSDSKKDYVKKNFTLYDFRRLMESHLTAAGFPQDDSVRRNLTWRPIKSIVEDYQSINSISGAMEQANARAMSTYVMLSKGNQLMQNDKLIMTQAQFLEEIGIPTSDYTKTYRVPKDAYTTLPQAEQSVFIKNKKGITFDSLTSLELDDPIEVNKDSARLYLAEGQLDQRKRIEEKKKELANIESENKYTRSFDGTFNLDAEDNRSVFEKLKNMGYKGYDVTKEIAKKGAKAIAAATILETGRTFLQDPVATSAELAKELTLERALGVGKGTTLGFVLQPKRMGDSELVKEGENPTGFASKMDLRKQRVANEFDIMERVATEDADMDLQINQQPLTGEENATR
tara:strand:- start:1540 stop:3423 length:1884 start_codon:yes stop_codon:yes gene_type:complete